MGDCLKQARNFMHKCEIALTTMDDACAISKTTALAAVQSEAKISHARGIYRAAQETLTAIDDQTAFARRLNTLTSLISQYENGLLELEVSEPHIPHTDTSPLDTCVAEIGLPPEDRLQRAVEALNSALPFATQNERAALTTLLKHTTPTLECDITTDVADKTTARETQLSVSEAKSVQKKLPLDMIISDVVHQGLSAARQYGLTVSLSYDMGGISLAETKLHVMNSRLKDWLDHLIRHISASAEANSFIHIDIAAQKDGVILSTQSTALATDVLNTAPDTLRVNQNWDASTGQLKLCLYFKDIISLPHKKTPKMPVEAGLASRLEALMSEDNDLNLIEEMSVDLTIDGSLSSSPLQKRTAS